MTAMSLPTIMNLHPLLYMDNFLVLNVSSYSDMRLLSDQMNFTTFLHVKILQLQLHRLNQIGILKRFIRGNS